MVALLKWFALLFTFNKSKEGSEEMKKKVKPVAKKPVKKSKKPEVKKKKPVY